MRELEFAPRQGMPTANSNYFNCLLDSIFFLVHGTAFES